MFVGNLINIYETSLTDYMIPPLGFEDSGILIIVLKALGTMLTTKRVSLKLNAWRLKINIPVLSILLEYLPIQPR
ncbi:hypothetical protein EYC84_007037 [Monilinia fructicola]|uniref:Uncharacterized protein n=1 Tax=Monilinia fructicola TaxID=38448 RepID=A0A5M9KA96_MONFR|nr:hypothetical protein EYC84_007037 [Monilinia fructicola]